MRIKKSLLKFLIEVGLFALFTLFTQWKSSIHAGFERFLEGCSQGCSTLFTGLFSLVHSRKSQYLYGFPSF